MGALRNPYRFLKPLRDDDRAESGIGTLIVFIAMILVAAVAAGVLVRTATSLQQQAESTGNQATARVATGVEVVGVLGERNATSSTLIDNVTITIQLASGSPAIDLNELQIRWSDGATTPRELNYSASSATNSTFEVSMLRDADNSFSAATPYLNGNDLVKVTIRSTYLSPRTDVTVHLIPEGGLSTPLRFATPNVYATNWITLS